MRILFIDIDTLRPDHLGCYGYHRDTSPHIDRVAADGVSDVICLNPSHGKPKDGYDYTDVVERDLDFLRSEVPGVE